MCAGSKAIRSRSSLLHAEWIGGNDRLARLGDESADTHVILLVPREGGEARVLRVAFIAPGADLYFQLWRMRIAVTIWEYVVQFWMASGKR